MILYDCMVKCNEIAIHLKMKYLKNIYTSMLFINLFSLVVTKLVLMDKMGIITLVRSVVNYQKESVHDIKEIKTSILEYMKRSHGRLKDSKKQPA